MEKAIRTKKERINLRLESRAKKIIIKAAGLEGTSVSHFMLHSALERAHKTLKEYETIALNEQSSKAFIDALSAPVRFNSQLASALEEHSRRVSSK